MIAEATTLMLVSSTLYGHNIQLNAQSLCLKTYVLFTMRSFGKETLGDGWMGRINMVKAGA